MLVLPELPLGCASSVYADDTDPALFYVVPAVPRIRVDDQGRHALVFYKFRSVPPGRTDATGGGFLEFQTELVLDDAERTQITAVLRTRTGGAEPVLTTPVFLDGTAQLLTFTPAPGGLVEAVEGSAHPSLFRDNAAAFALTLSRDGAALLWNQLRESPSPVAVRYELSMMARLPAGKVHVWLKPGALRDAWASLAPLDPAAARPAALTGGDIAGVDVLDWPPPGVPGMDQLKEQLVHWGWDLLDQSTQGALTAAGGTEPDWTQVSEVDTLLSGRSTVVWPVRPSGNLAGVDGGDYLEVDLSDPIFDILRVRTRCNVDFARNRIAGITLRLRYGTHRHDVLFTGNDVTDVFQAVVEPPLGRSYAYSAVVQFAGTSHTLELPEVQAEGEQLLLSTGDIGWVLIDVDGSAIDWAVTDVVEVHLTYADAARGVPAQEDTVVLRAGEPLAHYERSVWVPVDQPWHYRAVHVLHDGRRVESPPATHSGRLVIVPPPFAHTLAVRLRVPAGFAGVAQHLVECEHRPTGDGPVVREVFPLTAAAPDATWTVGLLADEPATFRYRITSTATDGSVAVHDWVDAAGSQTVAVGSRPQRLLQVTVLPDLLDYAVVKLAQVSLQHAGPVGQPAAKNMLFQAGQPGPQAWTLPLEVGDSPAYSWSARFYLADGSRRSIPATDSSESVLILAVPPA
jgi:hypothetical protein